MRVPATAYTPPRIARASALIAFALLIILGISSATQAGSLGAKSSLGGRVGAFINNGDEGPMLITLDTALLVSQDIRSGGLYAEFFYSYAASQFASLEVAFGITNRTNLQTTQLPNSPLSVVIDAVTLYPIQLSGRFYPFGNLLSRKVRPYGLAGLALIYGTQTNEYLNAYGFDTESNADFSFIFGGGADVMLSNKIGLNLLAKYIPVDFGSDGFYNISDFSGMTITAGVFYTGSGGDGEEQ